MSTTTEIPRAQLNAFRKSRMDAVLIFPNIRSLCLECWPNQLGCICVPRRYRKDLATVLSYLAGRPLSKEEIWTAMELPRSTYYDQLDKGTSSPPTPYAPRHATGYQPRRAVDALPVHRSRRNRRAGGRDSGTLPPSGPASHLAPVLTEVAVQTRRRRPAIADLRPRADAPPL